MIALVIIKNLVKAASYYFTNGIIPKSLKEFITIALYKEEIFFSLLGSYKLITFKNMLVKVLKKHVANIMLKAAEKYKLLL